MQGETIGFVKILNYFDNKFETEVKGKSAISKEKNRYNIRCRIFVNVMCQAMLDYIDEDIVLSEALKDALMKNSEFYHLPTSFKSSNEFKALVNELLALPEKQILKSLKKC